MPELPEVETVVCGLIHAKIQGCSIQKITVTWPKTLSHTPVNRFAKRLTGSRFRSVTRRGKWIVFNLEPREILLIHLRMTGKLYFKQEGAESMPHELVRFHLDDGRELRFFDPRRFGRFHLLPDSLTVLEGLGPEPLDPAFSATQLKNILGSRKRQLKPLLMDQNTLAGIGNIYADEALWAAKIHPERSACTLSSREVNRLYHSICKVLRLGIKNLGTTLGRGQTTFLSVGRRPGRNMQYLKVFRRTGQPCTRCGTRIERIQVSQRSTHFCAICQPVHPASMKPS